jgi:hypothetical protein
MGRNISMHDRRFRALFGANLPSSSNYEFLCNQLIKLKGKEFLADGYQESVASSSANGFVFSSIGRFSIRCSGGITHRIIMPSAKVTGIIFGERTFAVIGELYVIDDVY